MFNPGAHGLSEVLYAFTSGANNNGSAFGGLSANTTFFNTALGFAMLFGRFVSIVLVLGLAGSLGTEEAVSRHRRDPAHDSPLFVGLLTGVIIIVTALTFFPALSLGPIARTLLALS